MGFHNWLRGKKKAAPAQNIAMPEPLSGEVASTLEERRQQRLEESMAVKTEITERMEREDPARARREFVRGKHFVYWTERIRQLKRDGRNHDALDLLAECIAAAERGRDGREPAPWYSEQFAIVSRKCGYISDEIEVLERMLKFYGDRPAEPTGSKLDRYWDRLDKARALREKKLAAGVDPDELTRGPDALPGELVED
ncbi:hypothetical protein GCM10027591_03810 [Zhihengliuella somnathii]